MPEVSDMDLLRDYDRQGSETAFATVVQRHVNLVYSVAFRQVGIAAHAEEITQAVFVILARKAASLRADTILEGWLHETTRLTALSFLRGERRRQFREQEAYMQSTLQESAEDPAWNQLAPLLDEALSRLGKKDRDAVMLRFFKGKNLGEVSAAMDITEASAQSRVYRAVEKLRRFFVKRGVVVPATVLTAAMAANSVHAAPVALAKTVTTVAIAKGATASGSTLTLIKGALKLMAWSKAKMVIIAGAVVLLAVGGGTVAYETRQIFPPGQPAELKVKWVVGKKSALHMEVDQNSELKSSGQPQPIEQGLKFTQDFNVATLKELPAGGWQVELEFVNEAMEQSRAGHTISSFDSARNRAMNKENPLAILGALVGARLEYFTDAEGKVQTIEGVKELTAHVAAVGTAQQRVAFNELYGGDELKNMLSSGDWLPNRITKVGESWPVEKDIAAAMGVIAVNMKITFKNWEQHGGHNCAHLVATGSESSKSVSPASGEMVEIVKGTISQELWFDPEFGVMAGKGNEDLTLKITTRTQTMTKVLHNKSQLTVTDVP